MMICITKNNVMMLDTGEPDFYVAADVFENLLNDREMAQSVYVYFNKSNDFERPVLVGYLGHEDENGVYREKYKVAEIDSLFINKEKRLEFYEKL